MSHHLLTLLTHHDQFRYAAKVKGIASANLIGYWPLAEPSGTTIVDESGNARNGAYTSVTLGQQGIGDGRTAATFNGTTSTGNVYGASLAGAFNGAEGTFTAWLQMSGAGVWTDAAIRRYATFTVDANNIIALFKHSTNNTIRCDYKAGSTLSSVSSTAVGGSTAWFHVAITWSNAADQVKVYINGAQVGATQTGLGTWAGALSVGGAKIGSAETAANFWSGNEADAALWTTPLSAAQVGQLASVG